MLKTLADVAPSPAEQAGPLVVLLLIGLACLAVVAGAVVLVVYLVRRNNRPW
jgi:hypothetical protein